MAVEAGRAALTRGAARSSGWCWSAGTCRCWKAATPRCFWRASGWIPSSRSTNGSAARPATVDALSSARPRTLIIGADLEPAGAAAILTAEHGLQVRTAARVARSLPVRTRNADRRRPRLRRSAAAARARPDRLAGGGLAGHPGRRWPAWTMSVPPTCACGDPPALPTTGASVEPVRAGGHGRARRDRSAGRRRAGDPVRHHRQRRRRADPPQGTGPASDARRRLQRPTRTSRSRWPPTSAPSRRKCVGRQASSPTPTSWTSRRATASATTAPWPPTTSWCRCRAPATVYTETTVHIPVPGPADAVLAGDRRTRRCRRARAGEGHRCDPRARSTSVTAVGWRCAGSRCAPVCRTTVTRSSPRAAAA